MYPFAGPYPTPYYYSYPPYYFPYAPAVDYGYVQPAPPRPRVETGGLVLQSVPDAAQVYVDGFYVGSGEAFGSRGRALDLPAGPHRVELRAPGYESLTFSVNVNPYEIVRFAGEMQPLTVPPPQRVSSPAVAARATYVIPNCYAGDRPPVRSLPPGCDRRKLQTRK